MDNEYNFKFALKRNLQKGNLVYEYNPFYNYRLDRTMIYYKNRLWEINEIENELGITYNNGVFENDGNTITNWDNIIPKTETIPIVYLKGQLVDFETDQLDFDIHNPVSIIPQWSYDNSVNLIINDGKNQPRLINSRFSVTERNKYLVCNRKGSNDTNIYDQGLQFDIDTSLYKKTTTIPRIKFLGVSYGGNLSIGNYHFYFRYIDEDGNESDFFGESGLVSIFIGNSADSIYSGFRNENSHKLIKFVITNTDSSYAKINIYYTKATSDIKENATTSAFKILKPYNISQGEGTYISISGFENIIEVPVDDINVSYLIYGAAETLDAALNMLFLANVERPEIPYEDLADCALYFTPYLDVNEKYNIYQIKKDYTGSITNTYYDPYYIYNKVGYWDDEIYRFGVVFIKSDNTLTDVFNTRGISELNTSTSYSSIIFNSLNRQYITYSDTNYKIINNNKETNENVKGVVRINHSDNDSIIGINFTLPTEVLKYLKEILHIKGFFFVRQKRIPTTLCQAYTIGIDKESHTPVLPIDKDKFVTESFLSYDNKKDKCKYLTHDLNKRLREIPQYQVLNQGAICPEYDVNSAYLNTLFSASEMTCRDCELSVFLNRENSHFYPITSFKKINNYTSIKVIGVEDNTKLVSINDFLFSARAGEAEEAYRFEYIGNKNTHKDATNLLRGSYGPYLGITGYDLVGHLIDIKIPGYKPSNMDDYFLIRYNDKSPFYAISDRFDLENNSWWLNGDKLSKSLYRGDCYICQFTHRLNRNFQDPSAPTNDIIVDEKCWYDNYDVSDGIIKKENFEKINLGDVNAVKLGLYITLTVRSTINLNIRALDSSYPDEESLFGHKRGFYPFYSMSNSGAYKIPESLCYNKGFEKSLSEKYNYEIADVPWIKNEFSNRIAYSNIQVQDAFLNGWRTFLGTHYKDYPKTYGSITKIIEFRGNIICIFEHGIALIPINERAIAGEGSGGNVYINTSNVLPDNPKIISDTFGSQWKESIIKTPQSIYGVDTIGKKIWRTDGSNFESISDFKVLEFLNWNITLSERELEPIIGIRNVKTHYNKFKRDVMFTFYDNLYGFEEKSWNICWNEILEKWITFYSWIPSYSENIFNQYFSFDRNTSKYIAKLGISKYGNDFSDGITLEKNIIKSNGWSTTLRLSNRNTPKNCTILYELIRDNFNHYKLFNLTENTLSFIGDYNNIKSEFYERNSEGKVITDEQGRIKLLKDPINKDKFVLFLNIKATIKLDTNEVYSSYDLGYYESRVALISDYNMLFLTTDFWKHGQSGIIDISDDIKPTHWYGKQHPFEFEFIVADNPQLHKIFDNLLIISNYAAPESFHYEIIGDCFDFAKDKKNMYIRLEATKELYQYNGMDIIYDHDYSNLKEKLRQIKNSPYYEKSTILPLYYSRQDTINEIEDNYHLKDNIPTKDFSALAGGEILFYKTLNEYRIWNHTKAVDLNDKGRLRGNMQYKEDKWDIQINPINIVQKNETRWSGDKIPIELGQSPIPNEIKNKQDIEMPPNFNRSYDFWNWDSSLRKEVKLKDKWIKIRIRYSGEDLAIISAIKTLYTISYA